MIDEETGFDPDAGRTGFAARLFRLRFRKLRLSQRAFADKFGFSLGALKDLEQSRVEPSRAIVLLVSMIEAKPDFVASAASRERKALSARPVRGHRWDSGVAADGPPFFRTVNARARTASADGRGALK